MLQCKQLLIFNSMENYFNQVMTDAYTLLTSKRVNWPYELDNDQKAHFMENVIKYFSEQEDYQKCSAIQKKLDSFKKRNRKSYGKQSKNRD